LVGNLEENVTIAAKYNKDLQNIDGCVWLGINGCPLLVVVKGIKMVDKFLEFLGKTNESIPSLYFR
jgi:hypothetical protein